MINDSVHLSKPKSKMIKVVPQLLFALVFIALSVYAANNCTEICCNNGSNQSNQSTYYPHETECGKFYECFFDRPILFECPEGLYFDPVVNTCNWNVNCGNLSTSTAAPKTTTTNTTISTTTLAPNATLSIT